MDSAKTILIACTSSSERARFGQLLDNDPRLASVEAGDAVTASSMMLASGPQVDALVLDAALSADGGPVFCSTLRRLGVGVPILVVGADSEEAVVQCLDAGANDYLARPVRPAEFAARVRAHLRLYEDSDRAVLAIGPYLFQPDKRLLQDPRRKRRILLTDKETAVLKFLYRARPTAVPGRVLLRNVWGYSPSVASHTVETHIYRLRRKIEVEGAVDRLVVNDGTGYRLATSWPTAAEAPLEHPAELVLHD